MTARAAQRFTRREVWLWAIALYAAWTIAWVVYDRARAIWPAVFREFASWAWLGAKLVVWCFPVWLLIARRGYPPLSWLGLGHWRGFGRGVAATLVFVASVAFIDAWVPGRWPSPAELGTTSLPVLFVILFVSPVLEEVLFRGYALGALTDAGTPFRRANLEAAGLFVLLHVPGWLFQGRSLTECATLGVNVALLGFLFGVVRAGGATLWSCVLMHVANNAWHGGWFLLAGELLMGRGDG